MRVPDRQLIWHVRLTPPIKSSKLWGIPPGSTTCRQAPFRERLRIVQSKTDDFWLKTIFPDFRVRRRGSCRCSSIRRLPKRHVHHPFYAQTVTGFLTNFAGCRPTAATTLGGEAFRTYSSLTIVRHMRHLRPSVPASRTPGRTRCLPQRSNLLETRRFGPNTPDREYRAKPRGSSPCCGAPNAS